MTTETLLKDFRTCAKAALYFYTTMMVGSSIGWAIAANREGVAIDADTGQADHMKRLETEIHHVNKSNPSLFDGVLDFHVGHLMWDKNRRSDGFAEVKQALTFK